MNQNEWVLRYLQTGKRLTARDALQTFGVMRLAARILDLKDSGYEIRREMVEVNNRFGATVKVARYFL
ncbi:MAG: hypothetical protein HOE82_03595 [Gammaproteobacteria bacterium]|jgi:hypothetical protein|nr:hypothetical protein [Gammaproteobacteria bacterium]